MSLEKGEDGDRVLYNAVYRALQAPERRRILFRLLEHNPQEAVLVPEDVHVGERELAELNIDLTHSHLPMLEGAGLIRWDRDTDQIHTGPKFGRIRGLLASVREHDPIVTEE